MHEYQGAEYEYSAPITVSLTSPGFQKVTVNSPLAGEAQYLVEYINVTTADASVYISADNPMSIIPAGSTIGYLLHGVATVSPKDVWSDVLQYVTIVGLVGATNSAIDMVIRFRRPWVVEIPQDIDHPNPHFTDPTS